MPYPQLPPAPAWMDDAACGSTTDPDRWFRAEQVANRGAELSYVRAICEACAVNPECLDYALHANVEGVWGGLTTQERQRMKRRARR